MIGVVQDGRLGNQLFQYAFAFSIGRKVKEPFYVDSRKKNFYADKYFILPEYKPFRSFLFSYSRRLGIIKFNHEIQYANDKEPDENQKEISGKTLYRGYFQSHQYFLNIRDELKSSIRIKPRFQQEFENLYGHFFKNYKTAALHIRRTDYLNHGDDSFGGKDLSLPREYFVKALKEIRDIEDRQVFFVSDDIETVREWFPSNPNFHFVYNSEIIDFQILMHAGVLVLSNSSFSWWAAFLNRKIEKVYAPLYWLGFRRGSEYPRGITNTEWVWLPVLDEEVKR